VSCRVDRSHMAALKMDAVFPSETLIPQPGVVQCDVIREDSVLVHCGSW